MNNIKALKTQAKHLHAGLVAKGISMDLGNAQDLVAQQYGFDDWNTLCGTLKCKPQMPTLAELDQFPASVIVSTKEGETELDIEYHVELCDLEGLAHVHDESSLSAYLALFPTVYPDGLQSLALALDGNNWTQVYTFEDLLGIKYLPAENVWQLADGKTKLSFTVTNRWSPKVQGPCLQVPEILKTAKGIELIALRSEDGSFYDHFVLVPQHLDTEAIGDKIKGEILRLKELDAQNRYNQDSLDKNYSLVDIKKFVESNGCTWADPSEIGENWD